MIEINNLTTGLIDEEFLRGVAKIILRGENKEDSLLSIALVGQREIRELSKKYRGKNKPTDVLSFIIKELGLGQIVICPQVVKKNAKKYDLTFKKESARVLIHGVLHLLGYDHEKDEQLAEKMRKKEEIYFSKINNKSLRS